MTRLSSNSSRVLYRLRSGVLPSSLAYIKRYEAILGAKRMRHVLPNTIAGLIVALFVVACAAPRNRISPPETQVLFVCEHGNVKSLMATSYFNRLASQRGLPYRALSRGTAPDSITVPPAIIAGLRGEGFDVATFHPVAVALADVSTSGRVILINTALPKDAQVAGTALEQWTDVPAASADYAAASAVLRRHVERLIDDLADSAQR
jgi:protein-tyrosine-phosphatase